LHQNDLGQLLILKMNERRWSSSLEFLLHRLLPGGILLGAPFINGAESTREFLIKLARAVPAVPFLAIEEEGGAMDPLRAFLPPLPAPRTAAEKGPAAVPRLGELVGAALQLLGFNTDLAPVLDLASPDPGGKLKEVNLSVDTRGLGPATLHENRLGSVRRAGACPGLGRRKRRPYNVFSGYFQGSGGRLPETAGTGQPRTVNPKACPPQGAFDEETAGKASETRAFSPNPQQVAKCGAAFLEGLERHNLLACGRHFPGLETTLYPGAPEPPVVSKSMAQLWREDLVPYRALLPRLPLVLVSTAAYQAYDFGLRQSAGLSPNVVEGLLRVKLGYNGVAIACGLETEAVRGALALEEAAVHALRAGCDMLLLEKAEAAERVQGALSAARESGRLPSPRVEQALERIQLAKQGLKPPHGRLSRGSLERVVRNFKDFSSGFADSGKIEIRKS
jgi:beta-glucosidase-like glycosyl hydrolase